MYLFREKKKNTQPFDKWLRVESEIPRDLEVDKNVLSEM